MKENPVKLMLNGQWQTVITQTYHLYDIRYSHTDKHNDFIICPMPL